MDLCKKDRDSRMQMEAQAKVFHKPEGIRESLYGHIRVSVRALNIIIGIVSILLIASIIIGIAQGM